MNTYDILPWAASAVGVFVLLVIFIVSGIVRYVGNNRIAIVEKLWSGGGSISGGLIALKGQAGFQPGVLRGGFHFFFPFQYPPARPTPGHHSPGPGRLRLRP